MRNLPSQPVSTYSRPPARSQPQPSPCASFAFKFIQLSLIDSYAGVQYQLPCQHVARRHQSTLVCPVHSHMPSQPMCQTLCLLVPARSSFPAHARPVPHRSPDPSSLVWLIVAWSLLARCPLSCAHRLYTSMLKSTARCLRHQLPAAVPVNRPLSPFVSAFVCHHPPTLSSIILRLCRLPVLIKTTVNCSIWTSGCPLC